MKIDFEKIKRYTGIDYTSEYATEYRDESLLDYIKNSIDYLSTHNKNYNNTQYNKIMELKEIFDCIEF